MTIEDHPELIKEIAILAEEMSNDLKHLDSVAKLYLIFMNIGAEIHRSMRRLRDDQNSN